YRLYDAYNVSSFNNEKTFTVSNTRNNPTLKNETTEELEFGVETAFLKGRVGMQLTYFNRKAYDQIIALDVSSTSGYSRVIINTGELQNTGFEAMLFAIPVKTDDFSWDISMNYSSYNTKLNSLYGDLVDYELSGASSKYAFIKSNVGGDYGVLYSKQGYLYDDDGNKIVDNDGFFEVSGKPEKVGSILPDFNGGVMNTFNFKGITLSALVDFQKGGLIYSSANLWATASGQMPETVGLNDLGNPFRDNIADGGGIRSDGVFSDGTPNDVYVDARLYFRNQRDFAEEYMYDASFIKLREVKIGYTLPLSISSKLKSQAVSISVVGRNLALLYANTVGFDPEAVNTISNVQGIEGGSLPSTRSIGFNINFKF
ncbi:MAG: SusC/RagA family TonB-linked outer membrane protein, partial [Bacteroidota bacterium]